MLPFPCLQSALTKKGSCCTTALAWDAEKTLVRKRQDKLAGVRCSRTASSSSGQPSCGSDSSHFNTHKGITAKKRGVGFGVSIASLSASNKRPWGLIHFGTFSQTQIKPKPRPKRVSKGDLLQALKFNPRLSLIRVWDTSHVSPKVSRHLLIQDFFPNEGYYKDLYPTSVAVTASIRCWNIAAGFWFHTATWAYVRPGIVVGWLCLDHKYCSQVFSAASNNKQRNFFAYKETESS